MKLWGTNPRAQRSCLQSNASSILSSFSDNVHSSELQRYTILHKSYAIPDLESIAHALTVVYLYLGFHLL